MRLQPQIQRQDITVMCVCSGALLAAKSGLLNNRQCTTHHDVISRLRTAAPTATIKENRIFVQDENIWTSAGITSGIDLALHMINRLCGPEKALAVAREMVVWFRRSGDDPSSPVATLSQSSSSGDSSGAGCAHRRAAKSVELA
jgi:transcriptional regulator GlxA family with amidase domain